jgi:hypothetical protein
MSQPAVSMALRRMHETFDDPLCPARTLNRMAEPFGLVNSNNPVSARG